MVRVIFNLVLLLMGVSGGILAFNNLVSEKGIFDIHVTGQFNAWIYGAIFWMALERINNHLNS